jgi:hypothetical protein
VSDKWSIYLNEYDRLLGPSRNKPIHLLEIGIQNGGSLEIWSQYFPYAQKLVGCDINPECAGLSYEDPRIAVVVGDVNSDTTHAKILRHAPVLDVIIDDGSHRSNDIVKSFARYFPHLADDGVFITEDLHCSYWEDFEGGLFDPFSSITFFKRLADVISHEHWGSDKNRADILRGFFSKYAFQIEEDALEHVHSVEFINSMCVIRRAKPERNRLGTRVIAGSVGAVVPKHVLRSSLKDVPKQTGNVWTARSIPPDEELVLRIKELSERDERIANLNQGLSDRDAKIVTLAEAVTDRDNQVASLHQALSGRDRRLANLNQALSDRDAKIVSLDDAVTDRDGQVASLHQVVMAYQNSTSWRVTKPLRLIGRQIRRVKRLPATLLSNLRAIKRVIINFDDWRRALPERVRGCLRGGTEAGMTLAESSLLVFVDRPKPGVLWIVGKGSFEISGWAADLEARSAVKARVVVGQTIHNLDPKPREDVKRAYSPAHEIPASTGFAITLSLRVGVHRMRVEVEGVDGSWIPVRRALLLRVPVNFTEWRRALAERVRAFLRGGTEAGRELAERSLLVFVDRPKPGLVVIVGKGSFEILGWAADLEACAAVKARVVVGRTIQKLDPIQRQDVKRAYSPAHELPASTGFGIVLSLRVGVHRMRVEVKGVDGSWIPVRRALLIRVPFLRRAQQTDARLSYSDWTRLEQRRLKVQIPEINRHIDTMVHKPTFTVVVDTRRGGARLKDTIRSIRRQLYTFWDVRVLPGTAAFPLPEDANLLNDMSLSDIRGEFIVVLQSGQRLARNALYEFAAAIDRRPDIDLVYGDEDSLAAFGRRRDPFHKPGWSPDYLETFNYIGFPACFRAALARGCFDNGHVYDFVLRFTERTTKVLHVPKVLGHGVQKPGVEETAVADAVALDMKALSGRLRRTGRRGSVYEHGLHKGCYGVRLDLKRSPLVSVVIPTAGKTVRVGDRRIDLIANVIGQIRDRSTYNNIEIIVVDNGDLSASQLRMLDEAECRRVTYCDPVFNVSKKLNLGVSIAKGELFLLMNDDIEILTPSWIERLLEHFEKPHVGVVGAKLLYPNERTQHVGVVHTFGNPDHVRKLFPRNDAGYFFSTCGVRNYSAVTGACMMTPAHTYREVGGYSEELAVSFNDVDFCMKVRRKGLGVVYAPEAELIHMESQSHVVSLDMDELCWYHQQWAAELISDPFYNARFLTVGPPTFVPSVNRQAL